RFLLAAGRPPSDPWATALLCPQGHGRDDGSASHSTRLRSIWEPVPAERSREMHSATSCGRSDVMSAQVQFVVRNTFPMSVDVYVFTRRVGRAPPSFRATLPPATPAELNTGMPQVRFTVHGSGAVILDWDVDQKKVNQKVALEPAVLTR